MTGIWASVTWSCFPSSPAQTSIRSKGIEASWSAQEGRERESPLSWIGVVRLRCYALACYSSVLTRVSRHFSAEVQAASSIARFWEFQSFFVQFRLAILRERWHSSSKVLHTVVLHPSRLIWIPFLLVTHCQSETLCQPCSLAPLEHA